MNYIFVDLDCTLVDTKRLIQSAGVEPEPGTSDHDVWVRLVTNPEVLGSADVVYPVFRMLQHLQEANVLFLTNRRESFRKLTRDWLDAWGFYDFPLLMRPEKETSRAGEFKASVIKRMTNTTDSVLIIDDDPDGSLEKVCVENGWTHLRVTTYA